jgi:hypothetical protein
MKKCPQNKAFSSDNELTLGMEKVYRERGGINRGSPRGSRFARFAGLLFFVALPQFGDERLANLLRSLARLGDCLQFWVIGRGERAFRPTGTGRRGE